MKGLLLALNLSILLGFVFGDNCSNPSGTTDKKCRKQVEGAFGKKDPNMDGSLSCTGTILSKNARGTGYFPSYQEPEGGCVDQEGDPLRTLQDYLNGNVDYVSVAMDEKLNLYGKFLCIPQLNQAFKKRIRFKVVDNGGDFNGFGAGRIDICSQTEKDSCSDKINRNDLTLYRQ